MKDTEIYEKSTAQEKQKHHLQLRPKTIQRERENYEKRTSCLNFVQSDFYQASFMISNFAEEELSEEDYNVRDTEVAKIVLL